MSSSSLIATSLKPDLTFNWVFLIEFVVCGVLTLFFLFYFNRLFATLVSLGIRAWTWHKYRVYIDIQALQISLLGGRIFFKGVRYHGNNETILIQSGYITWQYWLRNVRELGTGHADSSKRKEASPDLESNGADSTPASPAEDFQNGKSRKSGSLPCQLTLKLKGVEWFVYNRSVAYDAILASMNKMSAPQTENVPTETTTTAEDGSSLRKRGGGAKEEAEKGEKPFSEKSSNTERPPLAEKSTFATENTGQEDDVKLVGENGATGDFLLLRFLPVYIDCNKAAIVMGNENTRSVLITKFERASGLIDATSSNALDHYKQLFNFDFVHPVIQMKPNEDFKEDQAISATRLKDGITVRKNVESQAPHNRSFLHRNRRRAWHKLRDLVPYFQNSVESFNSSEINRSLNTNPQSQPQTTNRWQGLSRYLDESEQDEQAKWQGVEYAIISTIVDSPKATMSFYWDVPGQVPHKLPVPDDKNSFATDINGDEPPEWGLKLTLQGAMMNYGPWADRQRADLQKVFFPALCKDAEPAQRLKPDETRVATVFKLYVEFEEETTLRVPIREDSKNWKWKRQADTMMHGRDQQRNRHAKGPWRLRKPDRGATGPEVRSFGWLDIKVLSNTSITYTMDMVAGLSGFTNQLQLDTPGTEITTSVNHGLLWRSSGEQISCDLSNPLKWNGLHTWRFDIVSQDLELFLLREHIFLLTDLVDDWGSGPPPEYLTFSPFRYLINLKFINFNIYLNVNDSNIINNPSDLEDNTFVTIFGSSLESNLLIPLDRFRPHQNDISFDVTGIGGGLKLHVPPWNTQSTFLSDSEIATLRTLTITGKYQYNSTTSPSNTDTLLLDVHGDAPTAQLYGFVIRYYLKVKDNYFGEDMHFKTLEEYQQLIENPDAESSSTHPSKKSNDLDVIISVATDNANVHLPANLYSSNRHTRIDIASIIADLRFTNYYMDLQVCLSTLAFSSEDEEDSATSASSATSRTQLFVDDLNVHGHRLFGLPPTEPTYVCNWDFKIGAVTGECSTEFLTRLSSGGRGFGFSFDDDENALPPISPLVLHDITFLRATVKPVKVWVHVGEAALILSTGHIDLNFNDWAGSHFSEKLKLSVPDLVIACVDAESASRHRSKTQNPVETHAYIKTDISFAMIQRKLDFRKDKELQRTHVRYHDQRTQRAHFLLHGGNSNSIDPESGPVDPPAMRFPLLPLPLSMLENREMDDRSTTSKSTLFLHNNGGKRKSSFLSASSSSNMSAASFRRQDLGQESPVLERPRSGRMPRSLSRPTLSTVILRDISVSTGRQSSFYSAIGDHTEKKVTQPPNVAFSSSYVAPYFPLEEVEPDMTDLPVIPQEDLQDDSNMDSIALDDIDTTKFDEKAVHSSFILQFKSGIRAFFRPAAIDTVALLMSSMQAVEPEDILDTLQTSSITSIFALRKQERSVGKTTDFSVRVPALHLRFLNFASSVSAYCEADQYDLSLAGLVLTSRSRLESMTPASPGQSRQYSSIHMRLDSVNLSAKEQIQDIQEEQAAVDAGLEDIVFWMVSNDSLIANLNFKIFEVATKSNKLEYLASLIHRTNILATEVGNIFSTLQLHQRQRVQAFVCQLTKQGHEVADPLILTRPSYVLRSATYHLRTEDTWKVVTRLRQMYSSLDEDSQHQVMTAYRHSNTVTREEDKKLVLAMLERWRGWDLPTLEKCSIIADIYGPIQDILQITPLQSTNVALKSGTMRFILDPGPKQTEVTFNNLNASVAINPQETLVPGSGSVILPSQSILAQLYCADTSINLNWELCELVENTLKLYQNHQPSLKSPSTSVSTPSSTKSIPIDRQIHVVISTGKGAVVLHTINMKITSMSHGLKASALIKTTPRNDLEASIMLSAEEGITRVCSRAQELTRSKVLRPSIYVSHEKNVSNGQEPFWKIAGNCQDLNYTVQQDVLSLLDVIDLVIGDEVAQLHRLSKSIPSTTANALPSPKTNPSKSPASNINVALFLDQYSISIPLLPSLAYNIQGIIARASIAARLGSDIVFDFDIQENSHDIHTRGSSPPRSISLLHMSPINGRIPIRMTEKENIVSVFASIEPVKLDAAAIHNLLTALNRPEISSVIKELHAEVDSIQTHIKDIFGVAEQPAKTTSASKTLIYDVHLTLEKFDIFADASMAAFEHESARFSFSLGSVQVGLTNRVEQQGPQLPFPELKVALQQIELELLRQTSDGAESCGKLTFAAELSANTKLSEAGKEVRSFHVKSESLNINLFADTASTIVDVLGHLQNKMKDLDLSRERQYLRKLRKPNPRITINEDNTDGVSEGHTAVLFESMYALELLDIQVMWIVGTFQGNKNSNESEDLVLSFRRIDLSTKKENSARLTIEDFQLQMVPAAQIKKTQRSLNSALLPEVVFNVAYVSAPNAHRLAFQAAGKSLDLRLSSQFMIPGAGLKKSIESALEKVKAASATWNTGSATPNTPKNQRTPYFGTKRVESLLMDADFAGAVVHLHSNQAAGASRSQSLRGKQSSQHNKYGQFVGDDPNSNTTLRAPGLAWKVEYKDNGIDDPSLNAEVKVERSSNTLYPSVVPLILEMSNSVKDIVNEENESQKILQSNVSPAKFMSGEEDNILTADPSAVLGRTKLNLGLRICRQEFSLSCQPIALVTATAHFDDIYITINTLRSTEHGHFFAVSACFNKLQASVQHVYSRGSTGSFEVDTIVLSFMNSKHVSGTSGVSAILKISPTKVNINAKQLQDFLLFREIWVPSERESSKRPVPPTPTRSNSQTQIILVQRYQQVAATGAFPWNATVHIEELDVQLDLGQAIGKSAFVISNFWVSSKKNSDWEQNLCFGFEKVGVDCTGRLGGFVALQDFRVSTSIRWPAREKALNETPLVEGTLKFSQLRIKASFDYQPFLVSDITSFEFLMYNVRSSPGVKGDRLVATLDGDSVQIFCTSSSASQALALYQAILKLAQEKKSNYEASIQEIEKFTSRRKSTATTSSLPIISKAPNQEQEKATKSPISLHTDVVVTLKAVNIGAFPSTFVDNQVFKSEALDAQARFSVNMDEGKVHSRLGLTLGQLRIGLAGVKRLSSASTSIGDISVEEVVSSATGSRGGTILKVPKVEASMQTWQFPNSNHIDYIFKSSFEGKVEVGWNYSRISFIRGMWANHSRSLAQRLGKPLPPSAVKITGVPSESTTEYIEPPAESSDDNTPISPYFPPPSPSPSTNTTSEHKDKQQTKITAEVNVPQSKYQYTALEPPVIQTPQLRDMGEATPPLEWIGLHRERLPNLTHQIVIVALLELASEVEDAYGKILGNS